MSPKICAVSWKVLVCVFERDGFREDGTRGSHIRMTKPGISRPVVIPKYNEVGLDIIHSNMRTAEMSRERYFQLLDECD
jgi:predicted RNA binding protein YcfA (HicA-like mRNA interferase family)